MLKVGVFSASECKFVALSTKFVAIADGATRMCDRDQLHIHASASKSTKCVQ